MLNKQIFGQLRIGLVLASVLMFFVLAVSSVQAAEQAGGLSAIKKGVDSTAQGAQLKAGEGVTLESAIGNIINSALGLVGVVLFGYLLYGGYKYMTAAGDSAAVTKALGIIRNAIIGIVIISMSYLATGFILDQLILSQGTTTQLPATQ
ncbi:MAG: hypothetical protein BWY14_00980 [Parcubacteria group bacterium ADurb.Bin192]|nr:MAG: hypothetical protein BWY14_00980 [Parcubacteria group bacterium ADurb.Bin192]